MRKLLCLLLLLAAPITSYAATAVLPPVDGGVRPLARWRNLTTSSGSEKLLDAVAGNASAATRTITIPIQAGWTDLVLQVDTTRTAHEAIVVTASCSINHGVSYGNINSIESAGNGAYDVYSATWTKAATASTSETFNFGIYGCDHMKLVVALTTGGAADFMTAYVKVGAL